MSLYEGKERRYSIKGLSEVMKQHWNTDIQDLIKPSASSIDSKIKRLKETAVHMARCPTFHGGQ